MVKSKIGKCKVCGKNKKLSPGRRSCLNCESQRKLKDKKKIRKINKQKLKEYLESHPCVDCGEEDIIVLQFDHINGVKKNNIADLVCQGYHWDTISKEIKKCEVLCANCHHRRTAKSQGWFKSKIKK